MSDRLRLIEVPSRRARLNFGAAVRAGLRSSPKTLPSRFFYDHRGSELFEEITQLPEYYLTRCEASIFASSASAIVRAAGRELSLVEFGSGSSTKTRQLMAAILERQESLDYAPIDISGEFLRESAEALLPAFPGLCVTALVGEYFDAIAKMPRFDRPRLILFLGSNIGNFEGDEAADFLAAVRSQMSTKDRLLIGIDLVKDPAIIEAAYNDSAGVTAEFNKNLLARVNRDLGGQFDLSLFKHSACFVVERERIEASLISLEDQKVCIETLDLAAHFERGEPVHTEISQKYTPSSFAALSAGAGLARVKRWTDDRDWFALELLRAE